MSLTPSQLDTISKQVYQKFPELKGAAPEVQSRHAAGAKSLSPQFLIIFKGQQSVPQSIVRVVRVTADAQGKVLKISTSK